MLSELDGVLRRDKFLKRLEQIGIEVDQLVAGYLSIATLVQPQAIIPTYCG